MSDITLWVRHGAPEAHWQLGTDLPPGARWTLLGWDVTPAPVDAGVPGAVRDLLSQALASVACVTFPSSRVPDAASTDGRSSGADVVRDLGPEAWSKPWRARLSSRPAHLVTVSTRHAKTIARLFDDDGFPWVLQSQVALLSLPDRRAPDIDFGSVAGALEGRWAEHAAGLEQCGVQAILRPAVDGDAVGVLRLTGALDERLVAAFAGDARRVGMGWRVLP